MKRQPRKLKNYLLNPPFQIRYAAMAVVMSALLSIALGVFVLRQMRENSQILRLEAQFDPAFQAALDASDGAVVAGLVGALLLFNVLLFAGSIMLTHRVAGPVYVLQRYVRMVAEGKLPVMRALRRGDEFRDLHQAVEGMVQQLGEEAERDVEVLAAAAEALPEDSPAGQRVRRALERKRDRLEQARTPTEDMQASEP